MQDEPGSLQKALKQRRPFRSPEAEAAIGLLHAGDHIRRHVDALMEPFGVTGQQYNVLRILRGAHPESLPTLEIAERMIERAPGITRLLDRLERKGFVTRARCGEDRRCVRCSITDAGLELLARLDEPVEAADNEVLSMLSQEDLSELIRLLAIIRAAGA
jgi:DNA-binding MarR family transcriptional regulator